MDPIVVIPGCRWTDTRGTDHRLAEALTANAVVLWVDPPNPIRFGASKDRPRIASGYELDQVAPRVFRLRVLSPPAFTRPIVRSTVITLRNRAIRAVLARWSASPRFTILLSPRDRFVPRIPGPRILHITDDWLAGSELMGLSRRFVQRNLHLNMIDADGIYAVSPFLANLYTPIAERPISVLPNGCAAPVVAGPFTGTGQKVAGIIGQLNERLDLDLLSVVADRGIPIEVLGPHRSRDASHRERLQHFLERPNVTWHGEVPESELWRRVEKFAVGLTPYAIDDFNKSSFPLKTLDYLACGVPVVATDLPAARWLDTKHVVTARSHEDFANAVERRVRSPFDRAGVDGRRRFAAQHTWTARAVQLQDEVERLR